MRVSIQKAINWIDGKLEDSISLKEISDYIGYSEFHTSRKFKQYTGSTLKRYITLRKLSSAAKELRDKNIRIIDLAFKYGFHSQEAFTRSFKNAFDITPGEYQKTKQPIPYILRKDVLYPDNLSSEGEVIVLNGKEIKIRLETIKEHKFIYLERDNVTNYIDFWELVDSEENMDCDYLHGVLASIKGKYNEGYGAFTKTGYIFGTDAPIDYEVDQKYGFQEKIIPEQKYLVFEHPGFNEAMFGKALEETRKAAKDFDFEMNNYIKDNQFVEAYEHNGMELCYYFIRVPLKSR